MTKTTTELIYWVQERLNNCLRLAEGRIGADKAGWMDDADHFKAILERLKNA